MIILFRSQKPRFIAKDDRWWVSGERELIEIKDPDRIDDIQDRTKADREGDNLIHYGHY